MSAPIKIELSELNLLPQWAKEGEATPPPSFQDVEKKPRRFQDSRSPRSGQRAFGSRDGGRDRRGGGGGRFSSKRDFRSPDHSFARERKALPELNLTLHPKLSGLHSLSQQIKNGGRSYPLFHLAQMVLGKAERYEIEFELVPTKDFSSLFLSSLDQSLWLTQEAAIEHTLQTSLERFYKTEKITIDPPSGNFTMVGKCSLSGTILGPPNHHSYQINLRRLYLSRFSQRPFEDFKRKIVFHKDEETIQKWKDQSSVKTVFRLVQEGDEEISENTPKVSQEKVEPSKEDSPPILDQAEESQEKIAPSEQPLEAPSSEVAPPEKTLKIESMEEVKKHFIKNHLSSCIKEVKSALLPHISPSHLSPELFRIFQDALNKELAFPINVVNRISKVFREDGLKFFKGQKKMTFVSVARPKALNVDSKNLTPRITTILDFIRTHPSKTPFELVSHILSQKGVSFKKIELLRDLSWLVHEGYVIEYHTGLLELPRSFLFSEKKKKENKPLPPSSEKEETPPSQPPSS